MRGDSRTRAWRFAIILLSLVVIPGQSPTDVRQATEPRQIDVIARRFAFEPSTIEVVTGERVQLNVRSADGVHGIEIKKVKVKKPIPRGDTITRIPFTAPEAGSYPIACSEYCGENHEDMKGLLVVRASDGASH
jgi:cytochrome c oxidase subunit 2